MSRDVHFLKKCFAINKASQVFVNKMALKVLKILVRQIRNISYFQLYVRKKNEITCKEVTC